MQVREPCVRDAPQRDGPTAEPGGQRRAGGGDAHRRLQRLEGRHRTGGILVTRG